MLARRMVVNSPSFPEGAQSSLEQCMHIIPPAMKTSSPVLGDVLCGDDQHIDIAVHLHHLACKRDGDEASRAAHAAKVVAGDVAAHLEAVDDHGCQ